MKRPAVFRRPATEGSRNALRARPCLFPFAGNTNREHGIRADMRESSGKTPQPAQAFCFPGARSAPEICPAPLCTVPQTFRKPGSESQCRIQLECIVQKQLELPARTIRTVFRLRIIRSIRAERS